VSREKKLFIAQHRGTKTKEEIVLMSSSTFNWPLFQLIIDCFLIILILYLLYVLLREHKQRLLLKKWILRQLRLSGEPAQGFRPEGVSSPRSVEEAIERLHGEIAEAKRVLESLGDIPRPQEEPLREKGPSASPLTPSPEPGPEHEQRIESHDPVMEAIRYLLKKGMSPLEISRQLHIPIEEVEQAYGSGMVDREKF
jgi:hypothetical protein